MLDDIDREAEAEGQALGKAWGWRVSHAKRRKQDLISRKGTNHVFGGDSKTNTFIASTYGADGQIPKKS